MISFKNKIIILIGILSFTLFPLVGCSLFKEGQATIEKAFYAHSAVHRQKMGEVLFIDEFEDNLTVYHPDGDWVISHYTKEVRDDGYGYICQGVSNGGVPIKHKHYSDKDSQLFIHSLMEEGEFQSRFFERLGRRPLYGYSHDSIIHDLKINGLPVDHVFETTNIHGEPLFFWYYSDFPVITGEPEDIIISFD